MILLVLFLTGLLAGTVDAIAGGGGLISMPMLLSLGVPPHVALGTNKFQNTMGTFVATRKYYHQGLVSPRSLLLGIVCVAIGAALGAGISQLLTGDFLRKLIPLLLTIILLYMLFSPRLGTSDQHARLSLKKFSIIFGLLFGFYDGFLGPGVGSFWVFAITFFLGFNLIKATAYTKIFNLTSNIVALACFMIGNNVDYRIGIYMAVGQMIGGWLGAHLAIRQGARLVRPFFLVMVTVTILSLLYKNYARSSWYQAIVSQYGALLPVIFVLSVMVIVLGLYFKQQRRIAKNHRE